MSIVQNIAFLKKADTGNLPKEVAEAVQSVLTVADFGDASSYADLFDKNEQSDINTLVQKVKSYEKTEAKPLPKSTVKAKAGARAKASLRKSKAVRKETAVKKSSSAQARRPMADTAKKSGASAAKNRVKAAPKSKTPKPEPKPITRTHIETAEHRHIRRYLSIRKKETLQLAMTAYKSLQKDITERKIRANSPQASLIKAVQRSYYKYLTRAASSLTATDVFLKDAVDFVGSQKPSETVALVKRFIAWTGKSITEKQLRDYLKAAEKTAKEISENDPYADELKAIIKTLKSVNVGDSIIAEAVGLSGLRSNSIKVRK